jgi:hypothetical protein
MILRAETCGPTAPSSHSRAVGRRAVGETIWADDGPTFVEMTRPDGYGWRASRIRVFACTARSRLA